MHLFLALLQLSLWIASVQAFFPYVPRAATSQPEGHDGLALGGSAKLRLRRRVAPTDLSETLGHKVNRIAQGLSLKYGAHPVGLRSVGEEAPAGAGARVAARDNTYSVIKAAPTNGTHTAGVDQDGSDQAYFVEVGLGSGPKTVYMLLDTGASTAWVMGSSCQSGPCTKHNTFGPDDSSTYKDTGSGFDVAYGTGDVKGKKVQDTVAVAGLSLSYQLGVADETSDEFDQFPFDGILGMSPSKDSFFSAVRAAGALDANVFGFTISRAADGANDGEVSFGGADPARYTGDIAWAPLTQPDSNSWAVSMDDVQVGGQSTGGSSAHAKAYVDTGTTFAFGPKEQVAALFAKVDGASSGDGGQTYDVPCDTDAEVAFVFGGAAFAVSTKDLVAKGDDGKCTGNVFGVEVVKGAWLLGDVFLKNVYSVFDLDQARIGFAEKATPSSSSDSGSSNSTSNADMTSGSSSGTNSMGMADGPEGSSTGGDAAAPSQQAAAGSLMRSSGGAVLGAVAAAAALLI